MEQGYANSNSDSRHHVAAQIRGNHLSDPEPPESVVFRSVSNLRNEIDGLSVQIEMLCGRIGAASRPCTQPANGQDAKLAEPTTSLLTKKVDDQARRVRMLSNQIATALDGLEL